MNATTSSLRRVQSPAFPSSPAAGFSLVELLGVIVLIGVISLGAYIYVGNASQEAIKNTKLRNAQILNQLLAIASAAGAKIQAGGDIDPTSASGAIATLNNGITVNGIPIKMNPPIGNVNAYTLTPQGNFYTFASDGKDNTLP